LAPSLNGEIPAGLHGLSSVEAERRLEESGPNRWVKRNRLDWVRDAVRLLLDPMAVMLAGAAIIYLLLGETRDAVVMAVALVPVLGVDVLLEARSRAALDKLARASAPLVDVVRDGQIEAIAIERVVPGDLLVLGEGHTVAADGVVQWEANLSIDESSLTGESEPQVKRTSSDLRNPPPDATFFAGSVVVSGHAFGRVTATGAATQYGRIAALVADTAPSLSPMQRRTATLVKRLSIVALVVAAGLCALGLARGELWTTALIGAISVAMAAMPEEFLLVLTMFLSVGAWRLSTRGMLVRRLASVETLGSTTVICTDKTGTLTRGEFRVTDHVELDPSCSEEQLLEAAVLACERHPADAMERAIAQYAEARGVSPAAVASHWTLVRDYDFDAIGKHMSHVWRESDGHRYAVAAKGAVEGILAHSRIDPAMRNSVVEANSRLAERGLRVLAVAIRHTDHLGSSREDDERDLRVCGLVGFQDPIRPEVPAAVDECQRAGVRIKMITGDHALTAHAVADAAGILHEHDGIVTGEELAALGEPERMARIARASIFARISAEEKFAIVDGLERGGAIVAMTGDGVNDAPALRRADIGIAMGQRGTSVARATADLVLLDDNFASIVDTIREGRHIFENIQRAFLYLIAFHIPIIGLAILPPLLGMPLLLWPVHMVWLELIVHPVSALVFQAEGATTSVMARPPRPPRAPLLPRDAVRRSAASGVLIAAATFAVYWWESARLGDLQARGIALVVLLAGYQTLLFAERLALPDPDASPMPRSSTFWIVWTAAAASLLVMLYVPFLAELFRAAPPTAAQFSVSAAIGCATVAWRLVWRQRSVSTGQVARRTS
jgi:Ca2+-transporting ATPase